MDGTIVVEDVRPSVLGVCAELLAADESVKGINMEFHPDIPLNSSERRMLIRALANNTTVDCLSIDGDFGPYGEEPDLLGFIAETLIPTHPSLDSLQLCTCEIRNEHALGLASALRSKTTQVKSLILMKNSIGEIEARALAEGIRQAHSLEKLGVAFNSIGLGGCRAIISACRERGLNRLDLAANGDLGVEGARMIADLIRTTKSKLHVGFAHNNIGDAGCRIIAGALPTTRNLESLALYGNNISDDGCTALAVALRKNCSLQQLDVSHNVGITDVGAGELESTLKHVNYNVRSVDLTYCEEIPPDLVVQITICCMFNRFINQLYRGALEHISTLPLNLIPKLFNFLELKPDLLFQLIKQKPAELFRERRMQRKRKAPERLQY